MRRSILNLASNQNPLFTGVLWELGVRVSPGSSPVWLPVQNLVSARIPGAVRATGVGPQFQGGASCLRETGGSHLAVAGGLPARLLAGQVAKVLNCSTDDVAILVTAGKLRALGKPRPSAVKFFSSIELITLLADPNWLDEATKAITQHWRRKNARRNTIASEEHMDAAVGSELL